MVPMALTRELTTSEEATPVEFTYFRPCRFGIVLGEWLQWGRGEGGTSLVLFKDIIVIS